MQVARRVVVEQQHRASGIVRAPGDEYELPLERALSYVRRGWVRLLTVTVPWHEAPRRELRVPALGPPAPRPVVACLNIWQQADGLRLTLPTWAPFVDAIVVADGPYAGTGCVGPSDDELGPLLANSGLPITWLTGPHTEGGAWIDQATKRTALLQLASRTYPDALLFIVDADEYITAGAADAIRHFAGDVGWITMTQRMYKRPYGQPRVVQADPTLQYRGRHHWLYAGDRLVATHQYGGTGRRHGLILATLKNDRGLGLSPERLESKRRAAIVAHREEVPAVAVAGSVASDQAVGARESLRILQLASYDAGFVVFRLHTAINATTPHASVFGTLAKSNRCETPMQYCWDDAGQAAALAELAMEADVVHCHVTYAGYDVLLRGLTRPLVMHHHGTSFRKIPFHWNADDLRRGTALRLVSNLELVRYGANLQWLPNPMPVGYYRALRAQAGRVREPGAPLRVVHAPTSREFKGTAHFLAACRTVAARGIPIEPVLLERASHADVIRAKAEADVIFDSFWLGMQCNGLEGAAMGLPVIAGDPYVADCYRALIGYVPYTFAEGEDQLVLQLEALATDGDYYRSEAKRVADYTEAWHDEAAVALRYLDLLDTAIGWRATMTALRKRS